MTSAIFQAHIGRDNGKRFRAVEVAPLDMAGFALRLVSALNIPDWTTVQALAAPQTGDEDAMATDEAITAVLALLRGCDAEAVHKLVTEALGYIEVSPDPKHPEAWRKLMVSDIQELRTLGGVLMTFAKSNLSLGG